MPIRACPSPSANISASEGDMVRMPPTVIKGPQLVLQTARRKVRIDLIVLPGLADATAASRSETITVCVNSRGRPWSQDGFCTSFFKMIRALERGGQGWARA